jgi:hypothetical protein
MPEATQFSSGAVLLKEEATYTITPDDLTIALGLPPGTKIELIELDRPTSMFAHVLKALGGFSNKFLIKTTRDYISYSPSTPDEPAAVIDKFGIIQ